MKKRTKKKTAPRPLSLSLTHSEVLLGWLYLGVQFLLLPSAIYALGSLLGGFTAAQANILYYIINAVSCCAIFRKLLRHSLENAGSDMKNLLIATVPGFLCYYATSTAMSLLILWLKPDFANVNDATVSRLLSQEPALMLFSIVALVPVAEECLFRGLLFLPFAKRSRILGYCVSCLSFAAIHVVGYVNTYDAGTLALCFVQYLPAGFFLAWACRKADSLFAPILIHSAVNLLSALIVR